MRSLDICRVVKAHIGVPIPTVGVKTNDNLVGEDGTFHPPRASFL
ncbi:MULTISPECIES: sedoheptulose 7-phosphate cyclase [Altibacter]|nr:MULTISPECIES: sedoheptulose 7-phosphate cyclase [Altibacter]MCW9038357.1 hypothetical protein [Altibacter sp.]